MTAPTPSTPTDFEGAFRGLEALLGPDRASRDPVLLERYGRSNVLGSPMPVAVARPRTRDEVVAIVRIAAAHRVALYPISRGQNWGYGAACPPTEGQVIVDMRDLDRILEVNVELGYAIVEPGVTPRQLHEYLVEHKLPVMMDCTDATPDTSVLGNIMDRGMGFTPNGDRFGSACAFEVVLADGSVIETGLAQFPAARAKHTHKWGVGPSIDGLFTQSSLGIVLRLTTWLMPRPEAFRAIFVVTRPGELEKLVDRLRQLRLAGVVTSTVHLAPARWPSSLAPEGAWLAMAGLYGPTGIVREAQRTVEDSLAPLGTCAFIDPDAGGFDASMHDVLLALGIPDERGEAEQKLATKVLSHLRMFAELHRGVPFTEDVVLITPHPQLDAPEPSRFGHYSHGPICPAVGRDAAELLALIGRVYAEFGLRYTGSSFVFINPRTLIAVAHIVFDREDEATGIRAKACIDRLIQVLIENGYPPYRVGIQSMNALDPAGSTFWTTIRRLKAALDPDGIIAPGRYLPLASGERNGGGEIS